MLLNKNGKVINDILEIAGKKIIFYGASTRNKTVIEELQIEEQVLLYVDSNPELEGKKLDGYEICLPSKICEYPDCRIITVLSQCVEDVLQTVAQNGNNECYIYIKEEYASLKDLTTNNNNVIRQGADWKYIHLITCSLVFVNIMYGLLEKEFEIKEHLFIVHILSRDFDNKQLYQYLCDVNQRNHNVLVIDELSGIPQFADSRVNCNSFIYGRDFDNILKKARGIVLHSGFFAKESSDLARRIADNYGNKTMWLQWGGESSFEGETLSNLRAMLSHVSFFWPENAYEALLKNTKQEREWFRKVPGNCAYDYVSINEDEEIADGQEINILLGHSAYPHVDHRRGLEVLRRFASENIKVYCPLNYGSFTREEKESLIDFGKQILGEKFVPLLEHVETSQWYGFLSKIDILLMPLKRMAGGTTIRFLYMLGKKIYVSDEIKELLYNSGIQVGQIEDIDKQSFEEFVSCSGKQAECRNALIERNQKVVELWKMYFEQMSSSSSVL